MGKTACVVFRKPENRNPILFEGVERWSAPDNESRCFRLFIIEENGDETTVYLPSDAVLEIVISDGKELQNSQS